MSLHIHSSAYYLKVGNRVINKITSDYNPPRFWFRLRVVAKGRSHKRVTGQTTNLWWGNFRQVKDFDPLNLLWVSEPMQANEGNNMTMHYFRPDITAGRYELAGLMHSKLPMRPMGPDEPIPEENIPDELLPEVELDQSKNEPKHVRKRRNFPYGIYYVEVTVHDQDGCKAQKSFKVWAFRNARKCKIRSTRFYERAMLKLKSLLPSI